MSGAKDARSERLKAALRENLRRRKAQDRGRAANGAQPDEDKSGPGETGTDGPDSDKSGL